MVAPGFTADCLETLEELDVENREIFMHNGGEKFSYIACLNDSEPGHRRDRDGGAARTAGMAVAILQVATNGPARR